MTTDFEFLNSFLGYGEPQSDIWFLGTEEHGNLDNKNDWDKEISKIGSYDTERVHDTNVRIGKFTDSNDENWNGYYMISSVLAKYLNITQEEAIKILGKDKNFYANLFPIPHIIEGGIEPEWFFERTGINYNDYFNDNLSKRIDLFCQAIKKYKPKDILVFIRSGYAEKFLEHLFKKFIKGVMNDGPSNLAYLPRIYWAYHPSGINYIKVKSEDWIQDIVSHF